MHRIRINYVIGQLGKGGAERQLYEIVKGIDKDRFEPILINLSQGGYWADKIGKLGIELIEIPRKKHIEFSRLFKLIKIFREKRPDIVHAYMFSANSYGRVAAILTRAPVIIASERSLPEIDKDKSRHQIFIDKLFSSFSHGIICNSYIAAETLATKYSFNAQKVFTVHNGIDTSLYLEESSKNQKKLAQKVVGTVGSLAVAKNHRLFLDMAKNIIDKSDNKDIKFLILGNGTLRDELERHAKHLGIKDKIVFAGERNDIPELLQSMDIFVMTSLYEGMSNAVMEAMAAGLPVVATDVGGNGELVIDGETGFLCPSNDAEALAERVASLIHNERERSRMGENGKKRIKNEFGIRKMIKKTESIYIKLLERKEG